MPFFMPPVTLLPDFHMIRQLQHAFSPERVEREFLDISEHVAMTMWVNAVARAGALSSRLADGIVREVETPEPGAVEITVASSFVGYPTSASDPFGDAGEAQRRGWATLAHRLELGYPGDGPWNPRAGWTRAAQPPPIVSSFEDGQRLLLELLQEELIRSVVEP